MRRASLSLTAPFAHDDEAAKVDVRLLALLLLLLRMAIVASTVRPHGFSAFFDAVREHLIDSSCP